MILYKKIYLEAFGYDPDDHSQFVPSEISTERSVDIHHILGKGRGGKDRIENLMALTRTEHTDYGDKDEYMVYLLKIHRRRLKMANIPFNEDWFIEKINFYEGSG